MLAKLIFFGECVVAARCKIYSCGFHKLLDNNVYGIGSRDLCRVLQSLLGMFISFLRNQVCHGWLMSSPRRWNETLERYTVYVRSITCDISNLTILQQG